MRTGLWGTLLRLYGIDEASCFARPHLTRVRGCFSLSMAARHQARSPNNSVVMIKARHDFFDHTSTRPPQHQIKIGVTCAALRPWTYVEHTVPLPGRLKLERIVFDLGCAVEEALTWRYQFRKGHLPELETHGLQLSLEFAHIYLKVNSNAEIENLARLQCPFLSTFSPFLNST